MQNVCAPWRECMEQTNIYLSIFLSISINFNSLGNYNIAVLVKRLTEQTRWTWARRYTLQSGRTSLFYMQQNLEHSWGNNTIYIKVWFFSKRIYPWRNLYSLGNHMLLLSYLTLFATHSTLLSLCFWFWRIFKILAMSFFIKLKAVSHFNKFQQVADLIFRPWSPKNT